MTIFGNFKAKLISSKRPIDTKVNMESRNDNDNRKHPLFETLLRLISSKRPIDTKVNTKSRDDNDNRKHSTKRTKSIENKSVVLSGVYLQPFWGYLYPFCSTFFTFFTLFSIFNFNFLLERKKHVSPRRVFFFFYYLYLGFLSVKICNKNQRTFTVGEGSL